MRSLLAALLISGLAACGEPTARHPVRVETLGGFAEEEVTRALAAAFSASDQFALDSRTGALRARAALSQEGAAWVVRVEVEVPPDLQPRFAVRTLGTAAALGDAEPTAEAIGRATGRAVQGIEAQLRLARGDAAAFAELLGSGEPEQLRVALRYVRDREERGLVAPLLPLLGHPDPRVRIEALDVIGALGTTEHAAAIVREVRLLDPGATREAYRALARLGGSDAIGFLRFAAANEDDASLRVEAERALSSALTGGGPSVAEPPRGVDLQKVARGHRQ